MISKPRKSENNTYTCNISCSKKKTPFVVTLENATIVNKKLINGQTFLFIKNKDMYNFFYDLNNKIIEIVKARCGEWFNNRMNTELIEDYYVNTLVYDKSYGDLIKIKCSGDEGVLEKVKCNIELCIDHLRFFKQKFVLECTVVSFETVEPFIDDDGGQLEFFEDDEVPMPAQDEIECIREEYLSKIEEVIASIRQQIDMLEDRSKGVEDARKQLKEARSLDTVMKVCEDFCADKIIFS